MMDDLISRQAAIDVCDNAIDLWHGQLGEGIVIAVKKKIEELLPAQPEIEERKEESAQNVPKEDLISRKAAIDVLATMQGLCTSKAALVQNSKIWQQIKDLPSAQPEPLTEEEKRLLKKLRSYHSGSYAKILDKLVASAQHEIIWCKECLMHGVCRFEQGLGLNGYCSQAERREE